jgi:hypothetical protein
LPVGGISISPLRKGPVFVPTNRLEADELAFGEDDWIFELVVRIGVRPQVVEACAELLTADERQAGRSRAPGLIESPPYVAIDRDL